VGHGALGQTGVVHEQAEALVRFGDDGRLTYLPGLDGIRGIAVMAVVLFHGNWSWMAGGYLGVSLFFTLSGFLITSLLIAEHQARGHIVLRNFWGRRFRRLLPAAWLTIGAVVAAVWWVGDAAQASRIRPDAWSALGEVANWRFLLAGTSYADLFRVPPPLLHFWSLAIEEQFYLIFPLVVAGALAAGRHRRRGRLRFLTVLLCAGAALSFAAPALFGLGTDRTYYGTDTRAGELLVGALLAIVLARPEVRNTLARRYWPRTIAAVVGTVALVACVVAWVTVEQTSPILRSGGLAVHAGLAALLILAAALPAGPVSRLASLRPLRWLGQVSYAVYLFHWPLLVFLTAQRTHLGHLPRFVLIVALSLLLAEVSRWVVERPIRERRGVGGVAALRPAVVAPVVLLGLVLAPVGISTAGRERAGFDATTAHRALAELQRRSAASARPTTPTTAPVAPVPKVAPYGDSVALSIGLALGLWELKTHEIQGVTGIAELGCGIARGGQRRFIQVEDIKAKCDAWPTTWASALDTYRPDLAIVFSQWELFDRKMAGDTQWRHLGDPKYDQYVTKEFLAATDLIAQHHALVVWCTVPYFGDALDEQLNASQKAGHDPERVDRLNEIIRDVVAQRPDQARLIDLAGYVNPRVDDTSLRKDGEHFDFDGDDHIADDFLGPAVVDTWKAWWNEHH
jgi:peptidoglycan/LPS O-acetylase OafA/YrhL